ncbi:hypothetical protein ENBRE01_3297 [Enteropsectra breve]|nr:hypothetical protein ENBRE01_3297 [Enteropsectra breve]
MPPRALQKSRSHLSQTELRGIELQHTLEQMRTKSKSVERNIGLIKSMQREKIGALVRKFRYKILINILQRKEGVEHQREINYLNNSCVDILILEFLKIVSVRIDFDIRQLLFSPPMTY